MWRQFVAYEKLERSYVHVSVSELRTHAASDAMRIIERSEMGGSSPPTFLHATCVAACILLILPRRHSTIQAMLNGSPIVAVSMAGGPRIFC